MIASHIEKFAAAPLRTRGRELRKVVVLGSFPPRQCGLATFTLDVYTSLRAALSATDISVMTFLNEGEETNFPLPVKMAVEPNAAGLRAAADYLFTHDFDIVFVQHEFGIFPGEAGCGLFEVLDRIATPVVTMCHTVLKTPTANQRRSMDRLIARSAALITMTPTGRKILLETYGARPEKVLVIPHGIPQSPPPAPEEVKPELSLTGRKIGLTFGLLSPGKGLEHAIDALPRIVQEHPDFLYVILGATHPNLLSSEGEAYRESLARQAEELGVADHVRFENRFTTQAELVQYLRACDVYITPYLNEAQITSGTLSYAFGCGAPVVSTPYWHAADLLADGCGRLVPFGDSPSIASAVNELLANDSERRRISLSAYEQGRAMVWNAVGKEMATVLRTSRQIAPATRRRAVMPTRPSRIDLQHLHRMTDDVGLFQHAKYNLPNLHEGYCTDDNCRALLLTVLLEELGQTDNQLLALQRRYAAFVDFSIREDQGTVRNFMGYDRRWCEETGSDDCHGRVAWTLGLCAGRGSQHGLRCWAARLLGPVLKRCLTMTSPRSWVFAALGAAEYQGRFIGETTTTTFLQQVGQRLKQLHSHAATPDWCWFEDILAYDNARLPQAAIRIGECLHDEELLDLGLTSLKWLCEIQTAPQGHFRPIGNEGFFPKEGERADFDQQPLEAWATMSAALEAYRLTRDTGWREEARKALDWFVGRNDLGVPVIDSTTGACCDGLQFDRVNRNQGAESTLSWLTAATEMALAMSRPTAAVEADTSFASPRGLRE